MATITITGSTAVAQRLLDKWGETASTVPEGEAIIKQHVVQWLKRELEIGDRDAHDMAFVFDDPEFT